MPRYAIINSGTVENVIIADAVPTVPGRTVVALAASDRVGQNDTYSSGTFVPYVPTAQEQQRALAPERLRQMYAGAINRANTLDTAATNLSAPMTVAQQKQLLNYTADLYRAVADLLRLQALD